MRAPGVWLLHLPVLINDGIGDSQRDLHPLKLGSIGTSTPGKTRLLGYMNTRIRKVWGGCTLCGHNIEGRLMYGPC